MNPGTTAQTRSGNWSMAILDTIVGTNESGRTFSTGLFKLSDCSKTGRKPCKLQDSETALENLNSQITKKEQVNSCSMIEVNIKR